MTQLTFDGAVNDGANPKSLSDVTPENTSNSWYKGRVLSHSSVGLYRTCPQKWKFRYVDKIPEKPRSFFSFGKSVHTGLEFLFGRSKDTLPTFDELVAHYKENWLREGYESPQQEKWFFQEGERILKGFYGKHKEELKNVFQVEFKFTFDIEGVPITGFIDRIDTTPRGTLAILDYKTGKAFDKIRVRQEPQLTLYQMAVKKLLNKEVETVGLYHLNSLTAHVVPAHTAAQEKQVVTDVVQAAKGINDNQFDPKPDASAHCQWCDYLQICPAFAGKRPPRFMEAAVGETAAELADKLGRMNAKMKELTSQRELVEKALLSHFEKNKDRDIEGRYFSVRLKRDDQTNQVSIDSFPKGSPG